MVEKLLEGNEYFLKEDFEKNRDHYGNLAEGQSPYALVIGCSDSRVNIERIFGAEMGEIFVHRNIGNIVAEDDPNLGTVLEYAIGHLGVGYVIVCGHSECGAMKALMGEGHGDYIPGWLEHAKEAKQYVDSLNLPEDTEEDKKGKLTELEKANIKLQVRNLRSYAFVKDAEEKGDIVIKGLYYYLENGNVEEIE
ncbi:carbonic anhydrase [Methanoplanus sp. FWC-SCC4]|uniref:carbonic anhydrase n=1 Tax=Methanochimaera problematica TaxID=2609417 RepID=A0AA97I3C8_9EURY|nr:carbonic anhydrase [Methanoplanus sp. FWC-SCC4]WOF17220.1 carbonic anhydrase [Methanoplanus sp. FWC-SCC4]